MCLSERYHVISNPSAPLTLAVSTRPLLQTNAHSLLLSLRGGSLGHVICVPRQSSYDKDDSRTNYVAQVDGIFEEGRIPRRPSRNSDTTGRGNPFVRRDASGHAFIKSTPVAASPDGAALSSGRGETGIAHIESADGISERNPPDPLPSELTSRVQEDSRRDFGPPALEHPLRLRHVKAPTARQPAHASLEEDVKLRRTRSSLHKSNKYVSRAVQAQLHHVSVGSVPDLRRAHSPPKVTLRRVEEPRKRSNTVSGAVGCGKQRRVASLISLYEVRAQGASQEQNESQDRQPMPCVKFTKKTSQQSLKSNLPSKTTSVPIVKKQPEHEAAESLTTSPQETNKAKQRDEGLPPAVAQSSAIPVLTLTRPPNESSPNQRYNASNQQSNQEIPSVELNEPDASTSLQDSAIHFLLKSVEPTDSHDVNDSTTGHKSPSSRQRSRTLANFPKKTSQPGASTSRKHSPTSHRVGAAISKIEGQQETHRSGADLRLETNTAEVPLVASPSDAVPPLRPTHTGGSSSTKRPIQDRPERVHHFNDDIEDAYILSMLNSSEPSGSSKDLRQRFVRSSQSVPELIRCVEDTASELGLDIREA